MKNLVTLFVAWLFIPIAEARWEKETMEDHFDPLRVFSFASEINVPNPKWHVIFEATEGTDEVAFYLGYRPNEITSQVCSLRGLTAKSKVDNALTPMTVEFGQPHAISIKHGYLWLGVLSSANHLRVRITDRCFEDFDMEFDVSGTPDLSPLYPKR